jgi:hypothetical protein
MNIHPARIVAGVLLVAGGFVVAVSALAIALAKVLVDGGMTVRPADAALLGDLVAVLPFIVAFAGLNLLAAVGLLAGKSWADGVATATARAAVAVGSIGIIIVVVGRDPFASTASARSNADGLGILTAFTLVYVIVLAALAATRRPRRIARGAAA